METIPQNTYYEIHHIDLDNLINKFLESKKCAGTFVTALDVCIEGLIKVHVSGKMVDFDLNKRDDFLNQTQPNRELRGLVFVLNWMSSENEIPTGNYLIDVVY